MKEFKGRSPSAIKEAISRYPDTIAEIYRLLGHEENPSKDKIEEVKALAKPILGNRHSHSMGLGRSSADPHALSILVTGRHGPRKVESATGSTAGPSGSGNEELYGDNDTETESETSGAHTAKRARRD
jgi:hypothetical protein